MCKQETMNKTIIKERNMFSTAILPLFTADDNIIAGTFKLQTQWIKYDNILGKKGATDISGPLQLIKMRGVQYLEGTEG